MPGRPFFLSPHRPECNICAAGELGEKILKAKLSQISSNYRGGLVQVGQIQGVAEAKCENAGDFAWFAAAEGGMGPGGWQGILVRPQGEN